MQEIDEMFPDYAKELKFLRKKGLDIKGDLYHGYYRLKFEMNGKTIHTGLFSLRDAAEIILILKSVFKHLSEVKK